MRNDSPFIEYRRAVEVLAQLEKALHTPRPHKSNLLIVGPSGAGKTTIFQEFVRRHQPQSDDEHAHVPVIFVDTPPHPGAKDILDRLLHQLRVPSHRHLSLDAKQRQLQLVLARLETKVLIFDDIDHAISVPDRHAVRLFSLLLWISNVCKIAIVASTGDAAVADFVCKKQRRNFQVIELVRWHFDAGFVRGCEILAEFYKVDLKCSPQELHERTKGLIGELADIFEEAYQAGRTAGRARPSSDGPGG
jgi:hypothetical protein